MEIYKLTNVHGVEARVMTYGATLVSLTAPDRAGHFKNIVLGFDSLEPYLAGADSAGVGSAGDQPRGPFHSGRRHAHPHGRAAADCGNSV